MWRGGGIAPGEQHQLGVAVHVVEVLHAALPGGGRVNIAAESSEIVTILLLAHDEVSDGRSLRLGERPGSVVRIKTFIIGRSALCKANSLSPHPSSPWPGPTIPVEAVVPVAVHAAAAEDGVVVGPGLPPEAGLRGQGHETKVHTKVRNHREGPRRGPG